MKGFVSLVVVKHPVDRVWVTVRDRLPELGAMLEDVESIVTRERQVVEPGEVRLVNEWRSSQRIPPVLRNRLGLSELSWLDRNVWDEADHRCSWVIEPTMLTQHVHCAGSTCYEPAMGGRGTRVTFAGEFDLEPEALATFAGSLQKPIAAFVEAVATTVIPRNVRRVMEAAARLIDAESGPPGSGQA